MPQTLDKALVHDRFCRKLESYDDHASIQSDMARRLVGRLEGFERTRFPRAMEVGCGSGTLTRIVVERLDIDTLYANDIIEDCRDIIEQLAADSAGKEISFFPGDIESTELPGDLDLVVSNSTFQWIGNLGDLLVRLGVSMRTDGLLAFTTFGPENLREIRDLTGVGLAYPSGTEIETMLKKDFRVLHRTEELTSLHFDTPLDVMRHLRKTGVNALRRESWNRSSLERFTDSYHGRWGAGEKVPLTYHPIIFVAEKKGSGAASGAGGTGSRSAP